MAAALADACPTALQSGVVAGTHARLPIPSLLTWIQAAHPVPDPRSFAAGEAALRLAGSVPADGALVVLLSGGASALMAAPIDALSMAAKQEATAVLLRAGADIHGLNAVRKHLSRVKGGRLAAACPGPTLAFALSDVIDDDLSVIGSGPTVGDPTTYADALATLDRLDVGARFPREARSVLERGARGELPETPKPGDARLARSVARVIGSRRDALAGARHEAEACGYAVAIDSTPVTGDARLAGPRVVERARSLARDLPRPACVLSGGETTVRVVGGGKGGRNQELALAAAGVLTISSPSSSSAAAFALASFGTDGIDGPTDAAGAVADSTTIARADQAGLAPPDAYLDNNDSYTFFGALGDLIMSGPTDTNVGDVQVVLIAG